MGKEHYCHACGVWSWLPNGWLCQLCHDAWRPKRARVATELLDLMQLTIER